MVLGGNVNLITKESLIEIYLKPSDEERKNFHSRTSPEI